MKIIRTEIYKFSIPMHPFTIATGTMDYAQNIFIRIHSDAGYYGVGECSAFPMIVGETQATCFEMAKDFALLWKGKSPLHIEERMQELHAYTAFNSTIKSAFDMALYDLSAKHAGKPLYEFLEGYTKKIETDLTIGIDTPANMAATAREFKSKGVNIIKIKLGKEKREDIERVEKIRQAVGNNIIFRIDANQGWNFDDAVTILQEIAKYDIQFCEQPMRYWDDDKLPALKKLSPIKIMADESVFNHHDALRLIKAGACNYVNIKFAKSGGILEAEKINSVCEKNQTPCMMGGMLESRIALTAFAHFAMARPNIIFYDMDTCMLGHKTDPVIEGIKFNGLCPEISDSPGIGADVDNAYLKNLVSTSV
ncbi:MAG: dipeptide epimerase [Bacteroidetes bacterium]|nr:dipeptide epimerase [Bacteroidota bacterium]